MLKGTVSQNFRLLFFFMNQFPQALSILVANFAASINDTGGKFAIRINSTGGKFTTGVNNTSETGGKICRWFCWYWWQSLPEVYSGLGGTDSWKNTKVENLNTVPLSITREWQLCAAEKLSPFGLRRSDFYFENRYGFVRQFSLKWWANC